MSKLQLQRTQRATNSVPRAPLLALIVFAFVRCAFAEAQSPEHFLRYEIIATHPHDARAFTQGLAVFNGELFESRGQFGRSAVTINAIETGAARRRREVEAKYFAEGLAIAGHRVLQLTWQSGVAFIYDTQLNPRGILRYDGEGWGLAFDGTHWLMSDGSDHITLRRRDDFKVAGEISVRDGGRPVQALNELEYAQDRLYANVWHSDRVAVIDPASGAVESWIDFAQLRQGFVRPPEWDGNEHVLNGIAFNAANGHFYVTGKCWPVLYEIRLLPPGP